MTRRVLYFHHGGAIGGAPLSLLYLLQRIDREEFEPVVLTLRAGPVTRIFERAGIETHICPGVSDFSHTALEWYGGRQGLWRLPIQAARFLPSVDAARHAIRRFAPQLVHLNSSTLAAAARAARIEGVPTVWHIREPLAGGYAGLRRRWLRRRIRDDADRVIAISMHDASQLTPSPRTRVIYNFVDRARFTPGPHAGDTARRALSIQNGRPVVAMLGGVAAAKGTLTLVRAARRVRAVHPDVLFVVAGAEPDSTSTRAIRGMARAAVAIDAYARQVRLESADLAASDTIRFSGVMEDVVPLLAASDVLAFPSAVPHFGRPLIEAAAMGVPTVASAHGSSSELVENDVTGILVPPGDPPALASALSALLSDGARARAMGAAGSRRAAELFDADRNARATFDVYRELLG